MTLDQYKSSIDKLREASVINKYESTKLQMELVLSYTRVKTMRAIEELIKHKRLIGL